MEHTINGNKTIRGVSADVVSAELAKLCSSDGIRAADVVAAAQSPDSPLHPCFTWDDSEAAKQWRLEEARALIRNVRVVRDDTPDRMVYVHVPSPTGRTGSYKPVEAVANNALELSLAIGELRRQAESMARKIAELQDAARSSGDRVRVTTLGRAEVKAQELAASMAE